MLQAQEADNFSAQGRQVMLEIMDTAGTEQFSKLSQKVTKQTERDQCAPNQITFKPQGSQLTNPLPTSLNTRNVHALRPRLPPRLLHHQHHLALRTRRAPRTNSPHEEPRPLDPHRLGRQQSRPRRRPAGLARKSLPSLANVGEYPLLRDEREAAAECERGVCGCVPADYQEGFE